MLENDVLFLINDKMPGMSKGHKKIARYIIENYDEAAFETAATVASKVGVSESTVVRFAVGIGYAGYPEYQKALGNTLKNRVAIVKRLDKRYSDDTHAELIGRVFRTDADSLRITAEKIDPKNFALAVEIMVEADRVFVMGLGNDRFMAEFLVSYLKKARDNVVLICEDSYESICAELFRISENDCLIGIEFLEKSVNMRKALDIANSRKAAAIAITGDESDLVKRTTCSLQAVMTSVSIVDSAVAPMSLVNAIAVAVCIRKQDDVSNNISEIEAMVDSYQSDQAFE